MNEYDLLMRELQIITTCSGFFLVLTNSSLFGIVPPSQPILMEIQCIYCNYLNNYHDSEVKHWTLSC